MKEDQPIPEDKKEYKVLEEEKEEGEICPFCHQKTLQLLEQEIEIPFFGKGNIFSMICKNPKCNYRKFDVEVFERGEPVKWELKLSDEKDLNIRVVKSSEATVKIKGIMDIKPGIASNGYITNVEGILQRVKTMLMKQKDVVESDEEKKILQQHIKKINKAMWDGKGLTITINDPSGQSAIISEKAKKSKLKK